MRRLNHIRLHAGPERPLWLRLAALLAILLVSTASTVQVCHAHDAPLAAAHGSGSALSVSSEGSPARPSPTPADRQSSPEDHCPLCVAFHSALPAGTHLELHHLAVLARVTTAAVRPERPVRWHFELFSRPPPANLI